MNDVIVEYNNEGVFHLLAGNDDEAISCLRNSLSLLTITLIPSPFTNKKGDECTQHISNKAFPHGSTCTCRSLWREDSLHQQVLLDESALHYSYYAHVPSTIRLIGLQKDSNFYVYSRPFTFIGAAAVTTSKDFNCFLSLHIAVIIFNMALAHHRKAAANATNHVGQNQLSKAIFMYDMCLQVLENDEAWQLEVIAISLIKLAALNNKSQLLFESDAYLEACMELDRLLARLIDMSRLDVLTHFDKEALQGFILNIMLSRPCVMAPAA